MADNSIGISLVISAVDKGSAILAQLSAGLEKIGISAGAAGSKSAQAGQQMETAFRGVSDHLERTAKSVKKIEDTLLSMGTALTAFGAAITAPFALATKSAADFEAEMNKVKAFVDFSPNLQEAQKEFQKLTDTAKSFDQFAPTGVAQAITELGKAGQNTEQIIASLAPTLNLAFVENRDMRQTAEELVGIMTAMGLSADQTARATDVLAKTSAATTTSMGGLTAGMVYAAPIAAKLGLSFELTSAFLGQFAQNGFKGEMAGAGFRRVMEDLIKPTTEARATLASMNVEIAKTPDGSIDAITTFQRLRDAQMSAAQASAIFGTQGMGIALAAARDIDKIKQLTKENENATGSLQGMVDKINSGLNPALTRLQIAANKVSLQFAGPFLASFKTVIDGISRALTWLVDLGKQFPVLSSILVGGAGAIGVVATVLGGIALAAAALTLAWRKVKEGFDLVIGSGTRLLGLTQQKTAATQAETAAIERQIVSINKLAEANQRRINAMSNPKNFGPGDQFIPVQTGRSGASIPPIVQPSSATPKGAGVGLGGVATGISAGLIEGQLNLGPTENAIAKVGELGGMLAGFGPITGTIIAGISSWVKILTKDIWDLLDVWGLLDKKKPVDSFNARVDATLKDMDAQIAEGRTFVNSVETAIGRAVSDFGGSINDFADQWKQQFNEELPAAIRQGFAKAQDELKTSSGFAFDNIFAETAKGYNTLSGKLGAMKETLDTLNKATEVFYAGLRATDEVKLSGLKNEIEAVYTSEALKATQLASLEAQATDRRISLVQQEYNEKKSRRDQEYAAALAQIEKQLAVETDNAVKREEILKERTNAEKAYREQSLTAERALQDGIANELKRQQDAVKSVLEQRRQLEQQIRDEAMESLKAQESVYAKSLDSMERLRQSFAQASRDFQMALDLLPTQPERAMEIAKKAREEFKSLSIDVNALQKDLKKTVADNNELLRSLDKKLMTPKQQYESDKAAVEKMLTEAQQLASSGKLEEAAALAGKAKTQAAGLAQAPKEAGISEADAVATAKELTSRAIQLEEGSKVANIQYSQAMNAQIDQKLRETSNVIAVAQGKLLDANTAQLAVHGQQLEALGKKFDALIGVMGQGQAGQEQGGIGGTVPETPYTAPPQTAAEAPRAENAPAQQPSGSASAEVSYDKKSGRFIIPPNSSLTRAEKESFGTTESLLNETDRLLAQSRAESAAMEARQRGLKYLETQAGTLDQLEQRGFARSGGDKEFNANLSALQKLSPDTGLLANLMEGLNAIAAGMSERAAPLLDNVKSAQSQSNADGIGNAVASYLDRKFQSIQAEGNGIFTEGGKALQEGLKKTFGEGININLTVSEKGVRDATVVRTGH